VATALESAPAASAARIGFGRRMLVLVIAACVLGLALLASLALGARDVAPAAVLQALLDPVAGVNDHTVVRDLRVPRTVIGLLAGAAFALAGAVMQGLTRNPLAEPGLLGVNTGASLFVVLGISLLGVSSSLGYLWCALLGAAVATTVVYLIGRGGEGGTSPARLVLSGAALTAGLTGVINLVLLTDQQALDRFRFWQVGSLVGRDLGNVAAIWPFLAVGVAAALLSGRTLNTLALGEELARGLGQRTGVVRVVLLAVIVLLAGGGTALAGPLLFIGLVVPHLARGLVGGDYRWIVPLSALLGPALVLLADVVGRLVARPSEIEVGIVAAFIGAPVMILLLRRVRTEGL
jgi:iron complex transport system permease protein